MERPKVTTALHRHHPKPPPAQPTALAAGEEMISAAAAIPSAPSSALSPHAAPFTLPALSPGRRQDGDVSRSMDNSLVTHGEEKGPGDTHSVLPIECDDMVQCSSTVYAPSTHDVHTGQTSSWSGFCMDVHPSSTCSSSGMVLAPAVGMASNYKHQIPLTSGRGSKCSTLKIECPPNKASETDKNSCGFRSKLVVTTENITSNKETAKDDVFPDPSECSVDSPCWRGASTSLLSPFDVPQTLAPQSINQESEALDAGRKQSSNTVRHYEAPAELQSLVTSNYKNKRDQSQGHVELGMSKKYGDIGTNQAKESHEKKLEGTNQFTAKCTSEQKQFLRLKGNCMKQSGLNSSAPDFVPSSIGRSKVETGLCSSKGKNILGIFKAIQILTEVLHNSYSDDEIELEEHDYILMESVIGNLQNCLHKIRKGPIEGASDKAGLKAPHSHTTVLKSDVGKYNGNYIVDGGNGIIVNNFGGSNHMLNDSGKNIVTRPQPSLNNFPKKTPCEEEQSQVLVYKNLWVDAVRANCELKYQLKDIHVKINQVSSMTHAVGPRNNYFQVSDLGTDSSNSYGAALAHPQILSFPKDHATEESLEARNSQNLLYVGDCIQSGGNSAHSSSSSTKGYVAVPTILQSDHFPIGLQETGIHRHVHPGLKLASNRADGGSASSYVTGVVGVLPGKPEYSSSDWEHVLKEEIGWS